MAVFLFGCIAGAAGSYYWLKKDLRSSDIGSRNFPMSAQRRSGPPPDLKLTPEQDARFKEIMAEFRKQVDTLRTEQIPKIEAIRAETNRQLAAVLNPEQQRKFEAFLKSRENMGRRTPRGREFRPPPMP
jgi:Spy/CpxP family protein refolding chaperone